MPGVPLPNNGSTAAWPFDVDKTWSLVEWNEDGWKKEGMFLKGKLFVSNMFGWWKLYAAMSCTLDLVRNLLLLLTDTIPVLTISVSLPQSHIGADQAITPFVASWMRIGPPVLMAAQS
jgi:hypothetical protein